MSEISDNDKKMISILRKYGNVRMGVDYYGDEFCSLVGNIHTNGNAWTYSGYGEQYGNNRNGGITPIEETYLRLKGAMLGTCSEYTERK